MLTRTVIERVVAAALDEDAPWGDLTSEALIPADATARAELVAREIGVFSGSEGFRAAFTLTDPSIEVEVRAACSPPNGSAGTSFNACRGSRP